MLKALVTGLALLSSVSALPLLPVLDFSTNPFGTQKIAVLTFDDGIDPIGNTTTSFLDTLDKYKVPATFFVNSINYMDINTNAAGQAIIKRIVSSGYTLGGHTIHHLEQPGITQAQMRTEITGLQTTINTILGQNYPLTLIRTPFGDPYNSIGTEATRESVAEVWGQYGVHVGWNIDSLDSDSCTTDSQCIINAVQACVTAGNNGIILMHSPLARSANALPTIITYLQQQGYTFMDVESMVKAKYGYTSADLYQIYRVQGKRVTGDVAPYFPSGINGDDGLCVGQNAGDAPQCTASMGAGAPTATVAPTPTSAPTTTPGVTSAPTATPTATPAATPATSAPASPSTSDPITASTKSSSFSTSSISLPLLIVSALSAAFYLF